MIDYIQRLICLTNERLLYSRLAGNDKPKILEESSEEEDEETPEERRNDYSFNYLFYHCVLRQEKS